MPVVLEYHRASTGGQKHETVVEIEESVEATAQSIPAESPVDSQLPHVRIPKIPEGHGYGGRDAYEPSIISIGPYHHGKPRLLPMESLKRECFYRVKNRKKRNWRLDECFTALHAWELVTKARPCYSENTDNISYRDFLEMMMLDACFIIEYCICIKRQTLSDLVGGRIWMLTAMHNDLLLLENQLPFFVVEKIFDTFISPPGAELPAGEELMDRMDLVRCFCKHVSPMNTKQLTEGQPDDHLQGKHLLHFYRHCLFYRTGNTSDLNTALPYAEKPICTIRSATFLVEAGIELEQEVDGVMSVTFQNGIMKITPLFVDAFTVSQFRNLIALEKHDSYLEPRATAFAQFMDFIISTSKDVDLLRKKGILDHSLGSDEEIATIFNQLTSGILEYRTIKLEKMYKAVDKYCKTKRHLWWAILMKDYFGSPWTAISLVAAVILLSLTFIQTFFSMYSYFRPPSAK